MEDFSTTTDKTIPTGWTFSQINRVFNIVTLANKKGKWLEMDRQSDIFPSSIIPPLPVNFNWEYDVSTIDSTGSTGVIFQVQMTDEKTGTSISFNLTPVSKQSLTSYASTADLKLQLPGIINYDAVYTYIDFNDFNSRNRRARMTNKKTGRQFLIFINNQQILYADKHKKDNSQEYLLPEGIVFNSLKW